MTRDSLLHAIGDRLDAIDFTKATDEQLQRLLDALRAITDDGGRQQESVP